MKNPNLSNQNLNQKYADDLSSAKDLLKQLWLIINPYRDDTVEKATVFDFLLLMMFNIGHLSEGQMSGTLARFLIAYYESLDISLTKNELFHQGNKDLNGVHSTQTFSAAETSSRNGYEAQSLVSNVKDMELLNKYLLKRKAGWKV